MQQVMIKTTLPGLAERQQARRTATEVYSRAYLAQPIRQQDGSTMHLCWMARIGRAYDILAAEQLPEKRAAFQAVIQRFEAKALADYAEADAAVNAYAALCVAAEVSASLDLPTCECDGCQAVAQVREANISQKVGLSNAAD